MKICILYPSFLGETGGAGVNSYLRNLRRHLEMRGHEVYIISARIKENEEKRFYYAPSLYIWPLRAFTGNLIFTFSSFFKLIKIDRKEKLDLIYTIGTSGALGFIIKKLLKKPIVNHLIYPWQFKLHNIQNKIADLKQYLWFLPLIPLEKMSLIGVDKIITLTEDHKKAIVKYDHVDSEKIVVIPNGIDIPENTKAISDAEPVPIHGNSEEFIYLFVGRAEKEKGIRELIKAFNLLECNGKKLVIVGWVSEKIKHLYRRNNILFTGYISDRATLGSIYQNSDVFVLPTHWEGQSMAVLEAMSYGLPVIASDIPGMSSLIENEKNGFLVPPRDVEKLAEKMELITKVDYKKMGEYSREKAEREFSWDKVADKTINVFEEVINKQ
ncbi:glycosyltransferase family 1 protein [Methanophagales archaeon]|nr:MAG: glycosyltransferase family 1 protein [Methanophagales archaeon]